MRNTKMSVKRSYRKKFIKRLEELTAEELKSIFDKVLANKNNDGICSISRKFKKITTNRSN